MAWGEESRPGGSRYRPPGVVPDPSWLESLTDAAALLAFGSAILAAAFVVAWDIPYMGLVCGWFVAIWALPLHGAAWMHLARSAWGLPSHGVWSGFGAAMRTTFVASVLGFGLALPVSSFLLPQPFLRVLLFPLVPLVWAPVVFAHACLFGVASAALEGTIARNLVFAGTAWLALLSMLALGVELGGLRPWSLGLAGLTTIGYWLVHAGLRRAVSVTASGGPGPRTTYEPPRIEPRSRASPRRSVLLTAARVTPAIAAKRSRLHRAGLS